MTHPYDGPAAPGAMRIGDTERDLAAAALGEHYAAGRLDSEEYDERVGAVWAARTRAELPPLFDDLPGGTPPQLVVHEGPAWPRTAAQPGPAAGPSSPFGGAFERRGGQLAAPLRGAPTWVIVVLAVVLVPLAVFTAVSLAPFLIAGAALWFFLAGPGKCDRDGHHRWNRSAR